MDNLNEWLKELMHRDFVAYLPFVSLAINAQTRNNPVLTRLLEALIIGALTAGVSIYVAVPMIQKDVEQIRVDIHKVDAKVEKYHDVLTTKVERLQRDLYVPATGRYRREEPAQ